MSKFQELVLAGVSLSFVTTVDAAINYDKRQGFKVTGFQVQGMATRGCATIDFDFHCTRGRSAGKMKFVCARSTVLYKYCSRSDRRSQLS
jgi:hypothetical protein